jgi:predicted ferric reductase
MTSRVERTANPSRLHQRRDRNLIRLAFVANAAILAALWISHGTLDSAPSVPMAFTAVGQLSALYGTLLALAGLVLVARVPVIERLYGDRGTHYHRLFGVSSIVLITMHIACTVTGYAMTEQVSVVDEFTNQVVSYPYMLAALVAFGLLLVVGASSIRLIRSRLSYETWTGLHLYAYLAIVLAFGHQLAVGTDFVSDGLAFGYWIALFVAVFGLIARYRLLEPVALMARHRFKVSDVVIEAPGVVSIYVGGRRMDRLPAQAGQYFRMRLLARNEWWRCHPFSISAVPDGQCLRFTVKSLGDYSERLQSIRVGTRVMLEGPFGALTTARRTMPDVALIGAGIGVTPIRALFEELAGQVDVKLIYRASSVADTVFWAELRELERRPRASISWLIGRRGTPAMPRDPLSTEALGQLVPDIRSRDVFLCGPNPMMDAVERSLRELGVPGNRIHSERFAA